MSGLSEASLRRLAGVHLDLVRIVVQASQGPHAFVITEGRRSPERQAELVRQGKSQTMRSRHLTGHAVDVAVLKPDGTVTWDFGLYAALAKEVKACARDLGLKVEWGGDWKTLKDGPHFQLPWEEYPA